MLQLQRFELPYFKAGGQTLTLGFNGLVYYYDARPAGLHINHDAWRMKVKKQSSELSSGRYCRVK
jgi:uncharacterized protein YigE (DUF2233 family)